VTWTEICNWKGDGPPIKVEASTGQCAYCNTENVPIIRVIVNSTDFGKPLCGPCLTLLASPVYENDGYLFNGEIRFRKPETTQ